ncbi:MAG TPA: DNA adenine methylase [Candidatus Sulfotelmatobacter sp.]|jgi:DNA adenine methylase|nr:DNA adenine methylase [Candidatus Sulfotelmatobacter sp.]
MIGPLAYIGGKNRLAARVISMLPEHLAYVEPFAGGAQVFFHKQPSEVEVLNDLDGDIVNFLRVCQWHHEELIRFLRYAVVSRSWFALLAKTDPTTLTDIQRAGRFFYLQKNCFGGLVLKQHYHYSVVQNPNFNPKRLPVIISQAHERLQRVQIESLPYQQILERYDRPTTCFYMDPPYWERKLYRHNFSEKDFIELEQRLHGVRGRFLLSLDDHPEVRRLFGGWHIKPIEVIYTARTQPQQRYREVIISNFEISERKEDEP